MGLETKWVKDHLDTTQGDTIQLRRHFVKFL